MLFCKTPFQCISNSYILLKKLINISLNEIKQENSRNFFLIIVNDDPLYLRICSPSQPPLQKVILCREKSGRLLLKQPSNALGHEMLF